MIKISNFLFKRVSWATLTPLAGHMRAADLVFETLEDAVMVSVSEVSIKKAKHIFDSFLVTFEAAVKPTILLHVSLFSKFYII